MDRRTKEQTQTYVIMHLCQKGQKNIFKPLYVDKRTKEHNQTYVIMYLCLKEQENRLRHSCVDKRKDSNLCHYALMSKRTDEHTRTFMYGQKNIRT